MNASRWRTAAALLLRPLSWIVYVLSYAFPRSPRLWVCGSYKDLFNDNSKYLFLETALLDREIRIVWLSGSRAVVSEIRALRLEAYLRWSAGGIWHGLRAGVHIYSAYLSDTNFWLSGRANRVNLWHGIPLKKIERDIDVGRLSGRYRGTSFRRLVYLIATPYYYAKPHHVLAPSRYLAEILTRALGSGPGTAICARYPRTTPLLATSEGNDSYRSLICEQRRDAASRCFRASDGRRILYSPTWREWDRRFLERVPVDWVRLDHSLSEMRATLIVKLHPNSTALPALFDGLKRIRLTSALPDIYPVLGDFDCLITDYSSIYFDYLFLDREIVFFPYDREIYLAKGRSLYGDYETLTPGAKVYTAAELVHALEFPDATAYAGARERVRRLVWGNCAQDARGRIKDVALGRVEG